MKRGAVIAILAATTGLALGSGAWIASAQQVTVSGHATNLAEEQRALKEARGQADRARALSRQLEAQADSATREADRLNAQAAAIAARVEESEADLRAGQARIAIIRALVERQSANLARQQGPLVRLTAALQSFSRRPPVLAMLQPGSLRDAVHARVAFAHIMPGIRHRTASLRADLQRTRQLQTMAVNATAAMRDAQTKLAGQRTTLDQLERQKRISARGLSSTASQEAERALAMNERARDIGALIAQVEQAGARRDQLAALPGPQIRPGTASSTGSATNAPPVYRLPVKGTLVTGMGELLDSGVRSRGITIATAPGAQVVAPAKGRVIFAAPYGGFGQIVIIDHGEGWTTLITDLSSLTVGVGQDVGQGGTIGVARGGNHPAITVELRRQGRPIDIAAMMNAGA